jgi:hypothetical protein
LAIPPPITFINGPKMEDLFDEVVEDEIPQLEVSK